MLGTSVQIHTPAKRWVRALLHHSCISQRSTDLLAERYTLSWRFILIKVGIRSLAKRDSSVRWKTMHRTKLDVKMLQQAKQPHNEALKAIKGSESTGHEAPGETDNRTSTLGVGAIRRFRTNTRAH